MSLTNNNLVSRDVETNAALDSFLRGWDYDEDVGLIMAGSVAPDSRTVEQSTDGGQTFEHLGDIPWGRPTEPEMTGPCVVILGSFHILPLRATLGKFGEFSKLNTKIADPN